MKILKWLSLENCFQIKPLSFEIFGQGCPLGLEHIDFSGTTITFVILKFLN